MIYIYIMVVVLLGLLLIYFISINSNDNKTNLLEDVPSIYVNKEGLEKHALQISSYYSDTKNTNFRRRLMKSLDDSYKSILKGYEYINNDVKNKKEVVCLIKSSS